MIVGTKGLSRRTVVRGIGVTLGLPLLEAMVPTLSARAPRAGAPRRLGFIYLPNGVAMNASVNYWRPEGEGRDFKLSPILSPLAPHRDRIVVVSGLAQPQAFTGNDGNGDHTRAN